jgi:hypothetical protein
MAERTALQKRILEEYQKQQANSVHESPGEILANLENMLMYEALVVEGLKKPIVYRYLDTAYNSYRQFNFADVTDFVSNKFCELSGLLCNPQDQE